MVAERRKGSVILAIVKQPMIKKFLLSLLFAFVYSAGPGQTSEPRFNLVSTANAITPGRIGSITRDREGVMWFTDQTNKGIIRYDGTHMKRWLNEYISGYLFSTNSGLFIKR